MIDHTTLAALIRAVSFALSLILGATGIFMLWASFHARGPVAAAVAILLLVLAVLVTKVGAIG